MTGLDLYAFGLGCIYVGYYAAKFYHEVLS